MKNNLQIILTAFAVTLLSVFIAKAQIATGGTYQIEQSVIASGGGQNSAGGNFSVSGTIGQSAAGTTLTSSQFAVTGGFWTAAPLAPSAASVSVGGKILTTDGRGLKNAQVVLTDFQGNRRNVLSGSFGNFHFNQLEAGQTYIITVISKQYQFLPQVLTVLEDINDIRFIAYSSNK